MRNRSRRPGVGEAAAASGVAHDGSRAGARGPLPRWVPAVLSFVAGYVDSYTFLALFGLFVAQVTGSFVTAGAEFVTHDTGIAGKIIAIFAFLVAAALTAGLIGLAREQWPRRVALDAGVRDAAASRSSAS